MKDNESRNSQIIPKQVAWYINKKGQSIRSDKVRMMILVFNKIYKSMKNIVIRVV